MAQLDRFLKWLFLSSQNAEEIAMTAKGLFGLGTTQFIFTTILPFLGIHGTFDFATLGDTVYTLVLSGLNVISGGAVFFGALRKMYFYFFAP